MKELYASSSIKTKKLLSDMSSMTFMFYEEDEDKLNELAHRTYWQEKARRLQARRWRKIKQGIG